MPASLLSQAHSAVANAQTYILSRQSDNGGFSFYRVDYVDEPNLHDTYYAVAALTLWGSTVPRKERLLQFVNGFPIWGLSYLYHYAFTLDLLGCASLIDERRLSQIRSLTFATPPALGHGRTREWLENALMTVELLRRFAQLRESEQVVAFIDSLKSYGGYGEKPNLWETYLGLSALAALGKHAPSMETRRFVEERQVPAPGFALSEDSLMAKLDVLYAGVKCCALLGVPIKYRADVLATTMACQSAEGGFARAPSALPDLELTHRGLELIALTAPELLKDREGGPGIIN